MAWTHVVAALASVAAGALFLRIGSGLWRRSPVSPEPREAVRGFAVWWLAIGLNMLANAALVAAADPVRAPMAAAARTAGFITAGAAMWGVITYMAYLHTGSNAASRPVAVGYAVLVAVTLTYFWRQAPHEVMAGRWSVDVAGTTNPVAVDAMLTAGFLLPPVVAGILLLRLLPRMSRGAQRVRGGTVGLGIVTWALLHLIARLSDADLWQFFTRGGGGVVGAVAVTLVYRDGPAMGPGGESFRERIQQLV